MDGFFKLGEMVTGGGVDREGAFLGGLAEGTAIQQRRAQTQNALAQARLRVQEAEATEQLGEALTIAGLDAGLAPILASGRGSDFNQTVQGLAGQQGIDFRSVLGDPNADTATRQAAGLALRGDPVTAGDALGPGGELFFDVFNPDGTTVTQTGAAQIGADRALAGQRNAQAVENIAGANLDDARRENPERFRSNAPNDAPNEVPLGDQILDDVANTGTTLPTEGANFELATGISGVVTNAANAVFDVVELGQPFPDADRARNALSDLFTRTQIVSQQAVPGRPSNYLMEQLAGFGVNVNTLTRGDERTLSRLQQTSSYLAGEIERLRSMVNRGESGGLSSGDLSDAAIALRDLASLARDYEVAIDKLSRTQDPAAALPAPDSEFQTTASGVRFRPVN